MANKTLQDASLTEIMHEVLLRLGEDPERDGLLKTPERVDKSLRWLTRGYGLSVEGAVGDAIFAMWNAPIADDRHAEKACRAALAMQQALERWFPTFTARHTDGLVALSAFFWLGRARAEELENRAAVEQVIDFLELEQWRKYPVGMLPYGVQKRVELGRALRRLG